VWLNLLYGTLYHYMALSTLDFILIITSFFTSFITAVAGIGGGVMLLAVMVSVYPPSVVIPIHGAVQACSNGFRAWLMRHFIDQKILLWFTLGAMLGTLLGSQLVINLERSLLEVLLGSFILYMVWGPSIKAISIGQISTLTLGGLLSSVASLFIGASGPLVSAIINRENIAKEALVATHASAMLVQHGLKIALFGVIGFAFNEYYLLVIFMILAGFAGTYVGKHVLLKIPERQFKRLYKIVITILALRLLFSAFFG